MLYNLFPYHHLQGYVSWCSVLDTTSRAKDCFVDALDTASWTQRVLLCMPVMILSELSVFVFVPDSAFMSMCCNFHDLTPLPGLCVALFTSLMPLTGVHIL